MRYDIRTANRSCTLKVPIVASEPTDVYVLIRSLEVPTAILIRRVESYMPGDTTPMYLNMPLTGSNIVVEIFEDLDNPDAIPTRFTVGTLRVMGLKTYMNVVKTSDKNSDPFIEEWIKFRGQFAFNAGWLPLNKDGEVYKSDTGKYKICYVDVILDENGNEDITPMQVSKYTEIISVARKRLIEWNLTVPALSGILDHEYSHAKRNINKGSEKEADLNGLTITLGTGYPRYDVIEGYYSVIYNVDSEENYERLHYIDDFANKFYELAG